MVLMEEIRKLTSWLKENVSERVAKVQTCIETEMFKEICNISFSVIILPDGSIIITIISKNILETSSLSFCSLRGVARETKKNRAIASSNVSKEKYPSDDTRGEEGVKAGLIITVMFLFMYLCMWHIVRCLLLDFLEVLCKFSSLKH